MGDTFTESRQDKEQDPEALLPDHAGDTQQQGRRGARDGNEEAERGRAALIAAALTYVVGLLVPGLCILWIVLTKRWPSDPIVYGAEAANRFGIVCCVYGLWLGIRSRRTRDGRRAIALMALPLLGGTCLGLAGCTGQWIPSALLAAIGVPLCLMYFFKK